MQLGFTTLVTSLHNDSVILSQSLPASNDSLQMEKAYYKAPHHRTSMLCVRWKVCKYVLEISGEYSFLIIGYPWTTAKVKIWDMCTGLVQSPTSHSWAEGRI